MDVIARTLAVALCMIIAGCALPNGNVTGVVVRVERELGWRGTELTPLGNDGYHYSAIIKGQDGEFYREGELEIKDHVKVKTMRKQ